MKEREDEEKASGSEPAGKDGPASQSAQRRWPDRLHVPRKV